MVPRKVATQLRPALQFFTGPSPDEDTPGSHSNSPMAVKQALANAQARQTFQNFGYASSRSLAIISRRIKNEVVSPEHPCSSNTPPKSRR